MRTLADTRAGGGICGIRFKIDPSKVSAKTYTDGAMMIVMFGAGKLIKSETWLLKASDDIEWKSLTFLKDGKLSSTLTEYGSKLQIGLKQEDLAWLVGVRRETIGNLENGKYNPSLVLAWNIARVFGVPIEEVFTVTEE